MILPFPKLYLYAGIGIAVLIAVGVIYKRGVDSGKAAQKEEMVADAKVQMEEVRKAAEAEFQRISTASEAAIQEARLSRQASENREKVLVSSLANLAQQRTQIQQSVSQVPDSALRDSIVRNLGIRTESDNTTYYLPSEERRILEILTDYPLARKETAALSQQVLEVKAGLQALKDELAATAKQAEAERALRQTYSQVYTQAFNLLRQKKRSPKCLFLWKCGKEPLLSLPSPDSLAKTGSTGK